MTSCTVVIFLDTDILIYAHLWQADEPRCDRAAALLETSTLFVLSTQVLAEYSARMLRQGIHEPDIVENVELLLARYDVRPVTALTVQTAWGVRQRYGFSYWDAQIVASALEAGCSTLYTEDLHAQQRLAERLRVVNPLC